MKILLAIAVFILWSAGVAYFSIDYGITKQAGIEQEARNKLIKEQREKVKIVYKEKVKLEVKYRDRIKTIYQTKDPTGCLDATLGAVGLLPSTTNHKARSVASGTGTEKQADGR